MNTDKTVTVVFTRYEDTLSRIVYFISGRGFTHTAISFDENQDYYYSFNYKGFRREYPDRYRKHSRKSATCRLAVSGDGWEKMYNAIIRMEQRREQFRFTLFGVIMCILGINVRLKDRYFCSQFVAETLQMSEDIHLKRKPALYLPNRLYRELADHKSLKDVSASVGFRG